MDVSERGGSQVRLSNRAQRRWARSGRAAALLGPLTFVLAGCSAGDWERNLRFGWPTGVTKQATRMRVLWTWSGVTALFLGVIVWGLIFWCCIRYRKKSDDLPRQTKYNATVEFVCFAFPFIVIAGLFYRTVVVEDYVNHLSKNPDVKVQVDGFKWNWQFEYHTYRYAGAEQPTTLAYAGADGKQLVNPTDAKLPDYLSTTGQSTIIPILVIPVHKTVQFDEHSDDVLHSFWVPEFLFKRDVVPYGSGSTSRDNKFEITPTSTGSFVGRCAELCGVYHSQMNFEVRVVTEKKFEAYLTALKRIGPANPNNQALALKAAGMTPYATTTYPLDTDRTNRGPSEKHGG